MSTGWAYKFTFTFTDASTASITGRYPHKQMFDIWAEADTFANARQARVVEIAKTNYTPTGAEYPESREFLVWTVRPPGRLKLNSDGEPVCPNRHCGQRVSKFFATIPDLKCPYCGESMYPKS
jgi:hypothetical protein